MTRRVDVVEDILSDNDRQAMENRRALEDAGVFSLNLMASPGAGKTSLIERTTEAMRDRIRIGVIDGDLATRLDADRAAAAGAQAVQINTGGQCHLDAAMVRAGLGDLDLTQLDLLLIENVGNLVCTAAFAIGAHRNVLVASVPEGDDKPYKYPASYLSIDALVLNKIDLLPYVAFDMERFHRGVEVLNPGLIFFPVSCTTGEGLAPWVDWIGQAVSRRGSVAQADRR